MNVEPPTGDCHDAGPQYPQKVNTELGLYSTGNEIPRNETCCIGGICMLCSSTITGVHLPSSRR